MAKKVFLFVPPDSRQDIEEALDDILSSGLVLRITDEKGQPVSLEVAADEPEKPAPALQEKKPAETIRLKALAQKTSEENGIARRTVLTMASRGEDDSCQGERIFLTDKGGGEEELRRQQMHLMWDMRFPRVFLMELPEQAVLDGSASPWYPLGQTEE